MKFSVFFFSSSFFVVFDAMRYVRVRMKWRHTHTHTKRSKVAFRKRTECNLDWINMLVSTQCRGAHISIKFVANIRAQNIFNLLKLFGMCDALNDGNFAILLPSYGHPFSSSYSYSYFCWCKTHGQKIPFVVLTECIYAFCIDTYDEAIK